MSGSRVKQPIERTVAIVVVVTALLAAASAAATLEWRTRTRDAAPAPSAAVDSLAAAIAAGAEPAAAIEGFVSAGAIHTATLYTATGQPLASAGTASAGSEQILRSLADGRTLSVQPVSAQAVATPMLDRAAAVTIPAATAALLGGALAWAVIRSRVARVRHEVEHAARDVTYAARLDPDEGVLAELATSVNRLLEQIQQRDLALRRRTSELESANRDLESFAATVSHDLRGPVGSVAGFAQALQDDYAAQLDDIGRECIYWILHSTTQMRNIIEGLLHMSRLSRAEVHRVDVDVSAMARDIVAAIQQAHPEREVHVEIEEGVVTNGDERLIHAVLENLIGNAFKFTSRRDGARIHIGAQLDAGTVAIYVRDNGAGFPPEHAAKMFRPFQRLHSEQEFAGTGIGLATVDRIVQRHGGRVWAEGEPGRGATIYFTTGSPAELAA